MSIKLVMLKSGEDLITDLKEIKSNEEVIGYYFDNPLIIKMYESEEPTVLNEEGSMKQFSSKVDITFYPWIPLSKETKIPCSADYVVTIVEPIERLKTQYLERVNHGKNDQDSTIINESIHNI
tara:strand:- start:145 stop:513 length:369 start_codon:yes stop_codon:yes gene_type:complete